MVFTRGLKPMVEDEHAIEFCNSAVEKKVVGQVFFLASCVGDVYFNDSEEERTVGLDDGFGGKGTSEVGKRMRKKSTNLPAKEVPRMKIHVRRRQVQGLNMNAQTGEGSQVEIFVAPINDDMYEMENEHLSEELDSANDDSDSDSGRRKYPKFRKEDLTRDFKFKVGMEFSSLA
ncbi:hypothetical protein SESBI_06680 [Sesbania bispinosa]|nr:hypothetical protein SESBI_06680 [Sesbania bispinosa]